MIARDVRCDIPWGQRSAGGDGIGEMSSLPALAGIGLKPEHFREVLEARPDIGFFEVHAENYMVAGGPFHHHLGRIRAFYPLSLHGVGLSIGGEEPLDEQHLDRLASLIDRYEPAVFSEHLAWSSHGGVFHNDLLPLPYDAATLARVCAHVDRVQQRLRRRMLLENPATYVEFAGSTMSEAQFIGEVQRRTGCGLLLDVNNAYVSCVNHGRDAWAYLQSLPLHAVGQIHLAGFAREADTAGDPLLIDSHGAPVDAAVWSLYERVCARLGALPTLLERDQNLPPLTTLLAEAHRAEALMRHAAQRLPLHA
jgi:uncharacterized protein (UPF0276 family)